MKKLAGAAATLRGDALLARDARAVHCAARILIVRNDAVHATAIIPDGQSITEVHQEIGAVLVSPALAQGLKVEAGTSALEMRRTYKTSDGKVAQVTLNTHLASRFSHSLTLRRVKG